MARALNYLLESADAFDGYFIVGEDQERIGIVKQLVAECSSVFRSMLFDSKIKEEGDVEMPDVNPDALQIYLMFAYGALEIPSMWAKFTDWSVETALHVVDFTEKYNVPQLQEIALAQIKPTSADDLFPALYCVAKYGTVSLADDVQKIVQQSTKDVLESPDFLEICQESLLYILKEDILSVPEVELWKSVLAWAKHQVEADDSEKLKPLMRNLLPHIRLLTMPFEDIYDYVEPTRLFSSDEIVEISKTITRKHNDITLCSNNLKKRTGAASTVDVNLHGTSSNSEAQCSMYYVKFTGKGMILKSILCWGPRRKVGYPPMSSVTLTLYKQNEKQHAVTYTGHVICLYQKETVICPEELGWRPIELAPLCQYVLELEFGHGQSAVSWSSANACTGHQIINGGNITCMSINGSMIFSHIKKIKFIDII